MRLNARKPSSSKDDPINRRFSQPNPRQAIRSFYLNLDLEAVRKSLLLQINVDRDPIASCT